MRYRQWRSELQWECTFVFGAIEKQNLEDQKFKPSLGYTESLRQASAA